MEKGKNAEEKVMPWRERLMAGQIVIANAVPVFGVWFLGWQTLRPIFFYWLDGLLALWGLGVVATVVTSREGVIKATGIKLWLAWAAVIGLMLVILAVPSLFTAMYVFGSMHRDVDEILGDVFADFGAWFSLLIVIGSYIGQTISELRWKPALTIKKSGKERANLFIHRTLLMGLLVFWDNWGQPSRWALAIYVLVVASLYTYTQLYPEKYLQMIGFKTRHRGGIESLVPEEKSRKAKRKGDAKEGRQGQE